MISKDVVRVGAVVPSTRAEGPGVRFAIWVQGCTLKCVGCFNPHFWGSNGGHHRRIADLAQAITSAGVEGVTFLGGEPFEQAPALAALARSVRSCGLSVMTFTGYTREQLESAAAPEGSGSLLAETDLLVDGPYRADMPDLNRPWIGSTNQRFHFLSARYRDLEDTLTAMSDRVEIRVAPSGAVEVNGWATVDQLDELLAGATSPVRRGSIK